MASSAPAAPPAPGVPPAAIAGHTFDRSHLPLLLTLALGVFAGALDLGVLSPALTAIAHSFSIAPRDVAWTFTLYLFANVASIPVATKLADQYGRRDVYCWCVGIFAAGSVLAIAAPSFGVFLLARAIQAAGAGGIFPVAAAAIGDRVPLERRGSALGLLGAVWGLAAIIGPNIGGVVTHFFTWHWIFAANVPLAIAVVVLARRYLPAGAAHARGPLDVAGIAALSIGLLGAMVGLSRLDTRGVAFSNGITLGALAVSALAFGALIAIERRAQSPVIAPRLFATRQLAITYGLEIAIGILEGALFFIPAALAAAEGLSAPAAGALSAIGALAFVAVIPLAGRALDAAGSRVVLFAGATCTAIGLAIVSIALASLPGAIAGIAVAGIGFGALLGAPTRYIVTNELPAAARATGVGMLSIFLIVGQIFGGSLAGGIVGERIDDVAGYRIAYATFAAIAAIAALATLSLASRANERREPPQAA